MLISEPRRALDLQTHWIWIVYRKTGVSEACVCWFHFFEFTVVGKNTWKQKRCFDEAAGLDEPAIRLGKQLTQMSPQQAWKNGVPYAPCNNSLPECIKRRKRHVAIFQMYWAFGYHSTGPFLDAIHMRYTPLNYSECFQETTCFFFQVMLAVWRT